MRGFAIASLLLSAIVPLMQGCSPGPSCHTDWVEVEVPCPVVDLVGGCASLASCSGSSIDETSRQWKVDVPGVDGDTRLGVNVPATDAVLVPIEGISSCDPGPAVGSNAWVCTVTANSSSRIVFTVRPVSATDHVRAELSATSCTNPRRGPVCGL